MLLFPGAILSLVWYAGWLDLAEQFHEMDADWDPSRIDLWRVGVQMARDYHLFGSGPGTYEPLSVFYLAAEDPLWMTQLHNDWLETLITFGGLGFALILLALITVLGRWFMGGGIPAPRVFVMFL